MKRDPLGRPMNESTDPPRTKLLTDDAINVIANDVRTLPLAEVGRHVMPLIHHIIGLEDRQCQDCRHWVNYNTGREVARQGECTNQSTKTHLHYTTEEAQVQEPSMAIVTPFDWFCKGWEQGQHATDEARQTGR